MFFQLVLDATSEGVVNQAWPNASYIGIAVIILLLFILGFVAVRRLVRSLSRPNLTGTDPEKIRRMWEQIEQTCGQGIMGAKLSVIEADKLLDNVLQAMFMPGETLGERLKAAAYKYPNISRVWWAHKLRNQMVHDSSFEITVGQAKAALSDYRNALRTLNVL